MKMNRNILAAAVAASALMGMSGSVLAATATGDASADVIKPIAITKNLTLSFGKFAHTDTAQGSVELLAADGSRTSSTNVDLLGGNGTAGTFDITGANDAAYAVTLVSSATLTNQTGAGGETMTFVPAANATGTLSATGTDTLNVGGKLTVGNGTATQVQGNYTGSYDVTVEYN